MEALKDRQPLFNAALPSKPFFEQTHSSMKFPSSTTDGLILVSSC
jgi:hypothetical protein